MANRIQFIVTVDDTKTQKFAGTWSDEEAAQLIADAIHGLFWNTEVEFHKRTKIIRPKFKQRPA